MTREEAITLLKKLRTFHNGTYAKAIDMAIEALSAEAVQWWIPCSEKLPSESGWYVISVVGLKNITDVSYFYSDESKWSDVSHTQTVTAWMPLPTPYKGGDDK